MQRAATDRLSVTPEVQCVSPPRCVGAPVLRDRHNDTDGLCDDERLYYMGDGKISVTTLVDMNGEAFERYLYEAYRTGTIMMMTLTSNHRRLRAPRDESIAAILLCH